MPDEDDDLFKPTTFKEKIHNRIPDILFLGLILTVALTVANARRNGYIANNNTEQTAKQVNKVLFNDSVNQKIR